MRNTLALLFLFTAFAAFTQDLPAGYWPPEKSQAIIDKTQTTTLAPDLSQLSPEEMTTVKKLLEVGKIFQKLYEQQKHPQALTALKKLQQLDKNLYSPLATQNLLKLYRLNQGPITTTLDNKREPFLPVKAEVAGGGMYPEDATKEELENFLQKNPGLRASILHPRTVVRRCTAKNIQADQATLVKYPAIDLLHPGFKKSLQKMKVNPKNFYAVPYPVAYAAELVQAYKLLNEAADTVENVDPEFSGYLRNRARDLVSNDYESGDAAWVTGNFKNLNAQIGSYETYDDPFYGIKTFFSLSVLITRKTETADLKTALKGLQDFEYALPYSNHKKVKEDIPVGVYDVIADFAQCRGGNTATNLPNESLYGKRYGRIILIRANILQNPDIVQANSKSFQAAIDPSQVKDLTPDGDFYRTLWHEIGHYLGVDKTKNGEDLDKALQENADIFEEMKADLVALFSAEALHDKGYFTDEQLRSVYASGIKRVLQNNQPRRSQPYNTMQLMQWNFYLENGLLTYNQQTQKLSIHYEKYHEVIAKLLTQVLDIQYQGDKAASEKFIEQYSKWDESLHGVIAKNIRDQQTYRFRLFRYAMLGE